MYFIARRRHGNRPEAPTERLQRGEYIFFNASCSLLIYASRSFSTRRGSPQRRRTSVAVGVSGDVLFSKKLHVCARVSLNGFAVCLPKIVHLPWKRFGKYVNSDSRLSRSRTFSRSTKSFSILPRSLRIIEYQSIHYAAAAVFENFFLFTYSQFRSLSVFLTRRYTKAE